MSTKGCLLGSCSRAQTRPLRLASPRRLEAAARRMEAVVAMVAMLAVVAVVAVPAEAKETKEAKEAKEAKKAREAKEAKDEKLESGTIRWTSSPPPPGRCG